MDTALAESFRTPAGGRHAGGHARRPACPRRPRPLPRLVRGAFAHGRARAPARPAHPGSSPAPTPRAASRPAPTRSRSASRTRPSRASSTAAGRRSSCASGRRWRPPRSSSWRPSPTVPRSARPSPPRRSPARPSPRWARACARCGRAARQPGPPPRRVLDRGAPLEVVYICGPVVIVAGSARGRPAPRSRPARVFLLVGDLPSPPTRSRARGARTRRPARPHRSAGGPGVRVLIAVFALCGLAVGVVEVVVPAVLDPTGHRELTGVMLGAVGPRLDGRRRRDRPRAGAAADPRGGWRSLSRPGAGARRVGLRPAGRARADPARGGRHDRPDVRLGQRHARPPRAGGTLTEAFTWISTGLVMGVAAGNAARRHARRHRLTRPRDGALGRAACSPRWSSARPRRVLCPPAHRPPPDRAGRNPPREAILGHRQRPSRPGHPTCAGGGIGRRARLRALSGDFRVEVRVLFGA